MSSSSDQQPVKSKSPDAAIYASTINDFIPILTDHEDWIPWMYLDHEGHLTVGVGHLMVHQPDKNNPLWTLDSIRKTVQDIYGYGFTANFNHLTAKGLLCPAITGTIPGPAGSSNRPGLGDLQFRQFTTESVTIQSNYAPGVWGAESGMILDAHPNPSIEGIARDAFNILCLPLKSHNYKNVYYKQFNRFVMTDDGIYALAFDDIFSKIPVLERIFTGFSEFPKPGQLALIDLIFQGFPKESARDSLVAALAETPANWKKAAKQIPNLKATKAADANVKGGEMSERTRWRIDQFNQAGNIVSRKL